MIDIIAPVLLLGVLVYLLHRLVKSPFLHSPRRGLPAHRLTRPEDGEEWTLEREGWTISLSTTALNNLPAVLVKGQSVRAQNVLRLAYDAGILACTLGAVIGVGGALWSTLAVWQEVWREAELHARLKSETAYVVARSLGEDTAVDARFDGNAGIEPLIPGVTIPFSHLPTLALAFVVNQLIHELGHALSGALDEVQMNRFSFNLHGILPSATVSFPSTLDSLTTLRLTTAGASHNLSTYLVLFLLSSSGVQRLFWADRSDLGTTVQRVSPVSPLYGHLRPGDLITHVDDVFMGEDDDAWKRYLEGTTNGDEGKGWCVDRNVYAALANTPCSPGSGTVSFEPVDPAAPGVPKRSVKCLQTHPLLQIPASQCPCPSAKWLCVHPRHEEQVLRIRVARPRRADGDEGVILFAGERREVLEGVQVGKLGTRFWGGLVRWQSMFVEYMSIVAFSLFIFNLLPIPYTDGSALLRHLLSLYRSPKRSDPSTFTQSTGRGVGSSSTAPNANMPMKATLSASSSSTLAAKPSINLSRQYELNSDDEDDYDPEQGDERGDRKKEEGWKRRLRRGVEGGMMGVGAAWIAGWAMLSLLRSS